MDTWLGIPSAPRDEEFHAAIVEMLSDWSWTTNAIEVDGVQIIAPMKMPEVARIVDYLQRMGIPHRRYHVDSELGQEVVAAWVPTRSSRSSGRRPRRVPTRTPSTPTRS